MFKGKLKLLKNHLDISVEVEMVTMMTLGGTGSSIQKLGRALFVIRSFLLERVKAL